MAGVRVSLGYRIPNPYPNPSQTRDLTPGVCRTRDNPYEEEEREEPAACDAGFETMATVEVSVVSQVTDDDSVSFLTLSCEMNRKLLTIIREMTKETSMVKTETA
jgi:hypothetical protein